MGQNSKSKRASPQDAKPSKVSKSFRLAPPVLDLLDQTVEAIQQDALGYIEVGTTVTAAILCLASCDSAVRLDWIKQAVSINLQSEGRESPEAGAYLQRIREILQQRKLKPRSGRHPT
jgi:hypothetical protein